MTKTPGESPIESFQAQFAAYGGGDLSAPGSEATIVHIDLYRNTIFDQIKEAGTDEDAGVQAGLAFAGQLGTVLLGKTVQEVYEQHGAVVSGILGAEAHQAVLLERARRDTLSASQKAEYIPSELHGAYNYASEIAFRYANGCSELGLFAATPTELRFLYMQGGSLQDPNFLNRRNVTVLSVKEDGVYTKRVGFEVPSNEFLGLGAVARLALGPGVHDSVEKEFDQPLLDLLRMQLSAERGKRLETISALVEAESLAKGPLRQLESLKGLSGPILAATINRAFEAEGYAQVLDESGES